MDETLENLMKAFVGESQARNRYQLYAKKAKGEGFVAVSEVFLVTAANELEHAKAFFRMAQDLKKEHGEDLDLTLKIETEAPTTFGTTIENLKAAISGEHYETSEMYPGFADVADKEGHPKIAERVRAIAVAEAHHRDRYKKLLAQLEGQTIFKKKKKVQWVCLECGYVHEGEEPPEMCPSCHHSSSYFQLLCEEY